MANALSLIRHRAKKIRHKNEAWTDAISRASSQLRKEGKVGATKFIDKGETKHSRVTKTFQRKRDRGGHFKGYKKIGAVSTKSRSHTDKNKIEANIQIGNVSQAKGFLRKSLMDRLYNKLVKLEMAKTKSDRRRYRKEISAIKKEIRKFE